MADLADNSANFLDFLENVYGKAAREQISTATDLSTQELQKAANAFAPAFLQGLMQMSQAASKEAVRSGAASPSSNLTALWPEDMQKAMQAVLDQGSKAMQELGISPSSANMPLAALHQMGGSDPISQLHQSFMAYSAQSQLCEQVAKATGLPQSQLQSLFPLLTAYGLMPLMPPKLDDPAGWVDYLGTMGRQNFQRANKELEAMPSPLAAAFEGFRDGFFPKAQDEAPAPKALSEEEIAAQKIAELNEATLEMQTNYLKGLNGLFESYQEGFEKARSKEK